MDADAEAPAPGSSGCAPRDPDAASNVAAALRRRDGARRPRSKVIDAAVRQPGLAGYSLDRLQFVASGEADLVASVVAAHDQFAAANTKTLDLVKAGNISEAQRVQTGPRHLPSLPHPEPGCGSATA